MKSIAFLTTALCGVLALSSTAFANFQDKTALVSQVYENFPSIDNNDWMHFLGSKSLRSSFRQQQLHDARTDLEESDCMVVVNHAAFPGNDPDMYTEINYFLMDDDFVVAQLSNDEHLETVYMAYKIIMENNQYKIDDVGFYAQDKNTATWGFKYGYKERVIEYCPVNE